MVKDRSPDFFIIPCQISFGAILSPNACHPSTESILKCIILFTPIELTGVLSRRLNAPITKSEINSKWISLWVSIINRSGCTWSLKASMEKMLIKGWVTSRIADSSSCGLIAFRWALYYQSALSGSRFSSLRLCRRFGDVCPAWVIIWGWKSPTGPDGGNG